MKYIATDTQKAWDYYRDNLVPFILSDEAEDEMELNTWFDRWIDWIVGESCIDGNDIDYLYPYSKRAARRLTELGIPFEIRKDEE